VPLVVSVVTRPRVRATPKSDSRGSPSDVNSTLAGFTSPWSTPRRWADASASATGAASATTWPGASRPRSASRSSSDPPGAYCMASATPSPSSTTSSTRTTCGWSSSVSSVASRRMRARSADPLPDRRRLSATTRDSGPRLCARHTVPAEPAPIWRSSS